MSKFSFLPVSVTRTEKVVKVNLRKSEEKRAKKRKIEETIEYDIIFFEQFSHFYKGCKVMKELDEMMRENIRFLKKNAQNLFIKVYLI